ncbi:LAGLIDADG family homing endonuclease [Patescibacteria group bacterium]|nr:LAGLIDADG family homing endonuclease [Patescibacteria group bacterium]MBU1519116.1 LAGLIDADG family homing endonuclease [Patescibacteria group bacterium]
MGRTKPIVSADYVVGITDGEGCFFVNLSESNAYNSGTRVQLHFHIKLQAVDQDLLWKICNTLNCGNVYFQKEKRLNHAQML